MGKLFCIWSIVNDLNTSQLSMVESNNSSRWMTQRTAFYSEFLEKMYSSILFHLFLNDLENDIVVNDIYDLLLFE